MVMKWLIEILMAMNLIQPTDFKLESDMKIGLSYQPGTVEAQSFIEDLNVKYVHRGVSWYWGERVKGLYRWDLIDPRMDIYEESGCKFTATIGLSAFPPWDYTIEDFENFFRAYLERYQGRIHQISLGNEWFVQSHRTNIKTPEEYTQYNNLLYDLVQEICPEVKVVLSAFCFGTIFDYASCQKGWTEELRDNSKYLSQFYTLEELLERCENFEALNNKVTYVVNHCNFDRVDIHLYDDYENWHHYFDMVRGYFPNKEIICTEWGGPNYTFENNGDIFQADRMVKYFKALDKCDFAEVYYFKMYQEKEIGGHSRVGLIEENSKEPRLAYYIFKEFNKNR